MDKKTIEANRRKWIEFLRTKGLQQGFGKLERYGDYERRCCLGHACHILNAEKFVDPVTGLVFYGPRDDRSSRCLPHSVARSLNIDVIGMFKSPVWVKGECYKSLTQINDSLLFSLSEIADIIEEQFEKGTLDYE